MESTRNCSICQQEQSWLWSGRRLKDGSKIFVDAQGRRWAGRRCPNCERQRVNEAVHFRQFERNAVERHLAAKGFRMLRGTTPILVEREGQQFTVGLRRATATGAQLQLDDEVNPGNYDFYLLIFPAIREISSQEMYKLDSLGARRSSEAAQMVTLK